MQTLFIVLGILCLIYYVLMLAIGMDFAIIWLAAGIVLTGAGIWGHYMKNHGMRFPGKVRLIGGIILGAGVILFVFFVGLIFSHMFDMGEKNLDYVIVLGAQVRGTVPSKALSRRIKKAEQYLKENPDTIAVLSGGQGRGEDVSEARVMYECLAEAGIDARRLILEDKSTSTAENLEFSAQLIGKESRVGLISQNFHIYRALKLAEHQKYTEIYGIAAPSELIYQPHYLVREAFAVVKEKLIGNI